MVFRIDRPLRLVFAAGILGAVVGHRSAPAQGIGLHDLPALAKARSERQRPTQEAALEPFWPDLRLDYGANREFLDEQIEKVADLGDSVVPLLLERLRPDDSSAASRDLAANCARVLRRMEPASFTESLLSNLAGESQAARAHSIWLLGFSRSTRAARALREAFAELDSGAKRDAAGALANLRDRDAAHLIAPLLGSIDRQDRSAALGYLTALAPTDAVPAVLAAMANEKDVELLPAYVAYLGRAATANGAAADAMLPLLSGDRLDNGDTRDLVEALGTVAPEGHKATLARLREMLTGQVGELGRTIALAMLALGDKNGVNQFKKELDDALRRRERDANLWRARGDLYFALKNWKNALADYEKAERLARGGTRRNIRLRMAGCEARLDRWQRVLSRLRDSKATAAEILAAADEDEALRDALEKTPIRRWLNDLAGEGK